MARQRWQRGRGLMGLVIGLASLGLAPVQATLVATVASCGISPRSGSPGTPIRVVVHQWFSAPDQAVGLGLAVPQSPAALGSRLFDPDDPATLQLLDGPLVLLYPGTGGHAEATVPFPARLTSGAPIPQQDLYLVCMTDGRVTMGGGGGPVAFRFIPPTVPEAGQPGEGAGWLLLLGIGLIGVGYGLRAKRRWIPVGSAG